MTALAESIFNLVPETYEVYERAPVYKSKFVNASLTGSTFCELGGISSVTGLLQSLSASTLSLLGFMNRGSASKPLMRRVVCFVRAVQALTEQHSQ
jgi:hypothetical protein